MTPKIAFAACVVAVVLDGFLCATYSNVFVRGGSELVPLEYINYGGPVAYAPQLSQLSAPIESVVSLQNALSPCVAPCAINTLPLAPIPAAANAQIVAYKAPVANVPVVLANQDDSVGYQYAYAVYDEGTGDKKTQSEQSDGSVVQGQYSFIQPDGFRREVVYTADDLKGFNAIVKTISPETESPKPASEETTEAKESPCEGPKSEQIVEESKSEEKAPEAESLEEVTEAAEEAKPSSEEKSDEETAVPPTEVPEPSDPNTNVVVSYSDVINCLQSKRIANAQAISPLTYILVPAFNGIKRPC